MKKRIVLIGLGALYVLGIASGIAAMIVQNVRPSAEQPSMASLSGLAKKDNVIGYINMDGPIFFSEGNNNIFAPERGARMWISQLNQAATNNSIKAVLLRINSPGGTVGASQELYNAVLRVRDAGKPVVVSVADMAASGGYYTAVAATRIFINPGSLTGSIGVILGGFDASGLLEKIGIKYSAITSGTNKDAGTPYKPMSAEQRALMQGLIMNTYEQFLEAVAQGRGKTIEETRPIADGRIFTGQQALEAGLVDELGDLQKAESFLRKEYNLENAALEPITVAAPFKLQNILSVWGGNQAPKVQVLPENNFQYAPLLYLLQF